MATPNNAAQPTTRPQNKKRFTVAILILFVILGVVVVAYFFVKNYAISLGSKKLYVKVTYEYTATQPVRSKYFLITNDETQEITESSYPAATSQFGEEFSWSAEQMEPAKESIEEIRKTCGLSAIYSYDRIWTSPSKNHCLLQTSDVYNLALYSEGKKKRAWGSSAAVTYSHLTAETGTLPTANIVWSSDEHYALIPFNSSCITDSCGNAIKVLNTKSGAMRSWDGIVFGGTGDKDALAITADTKLYAYGMVHYAATGGIYITNRGLHARLFGARRVMALPPSQNAEMKIIHLEAAFGQ